MATSPWNQMHLQPRLPARATSRRQIPTEPGVYAWYRNGSSVYVGVAAGAGGLRDRVGKAHLATGNDLSRSSLRRSVCELLGIAPTKVTRLRPTVMTPAQVEPVNRWIGECEVAWQTCATPREAEDLEEGLLRESRPLLNKR